MAAPVKSVFPWAPLRHFLWLQMHFMGLAGRRWMVGPQISCMQHSNMIATYTQFCYSGTIYAWYYQLFLLVLHNVWTFSSLQWIQPHLTWVSWMRVVALCSSFLIVAGWPWRIACVVPWRRSQHQLSNKTWVDEDPNIPQPRHAKNIIIYYIC